MTAELESSERARAELAAELTAKAAAVTKLESETAVVKSQAEMHKAELATKKGACHLRHCFLAAWRVIPATAI